MAEAPGKDTRSGLEKLLSIITEVRAGEGMSALLMTLNVFLLLTAYYMIKPVREALILAMKSGAEYKSYMGAVIALALLAAVPAYTTFAKKVARNRLVVSVTLFFSSHLILFYLASKIPALESGYLGLIFYGWVGIFNMMVVAQIWAFANDIYTEEQGKRLFAIIGVGASLGAWVGSEIASFLTDLVGVYQMLIISALVLASTAAITQIVHVGESKNAPAKESSKEKEEEKKSSGGGFGLVAKHNYLRLLAAFSLVFTLVNTNGEYMLSRLFKQEAKSLAAQVDQAAAQKYAQDESISEDQIKASFAVAQKEGQYAGKSFAEAKDEVLLSMAKGNRIKNYLAKAYGDFFGLVNLLGFLLQMFLVSRLVKYAGFGRSFFILPVIALLDATAMVIAPSLAVLRMGKTAENATDYSLNNTLRNMLWLPTTKEMKYQAKQAVDTFFVRMGDVASAGIVLLGTQVMAWDIRAFAGVNLVGVVIWLALAVAIVKAQKKPIET